MEQSVRAIVLRRRDQGEADRRLTLLTSELGKIDVIAKGAKNSGSRLRGVSEPLSVATMNIAMGKARRFVTQAQPHSAFPGLRSDFDRLSYALAFAELVSGVVPWEQPDEEVFSLLVEVISEIEAHPKPLVALVWGEVMLLNAIGFLPNFDVCVLTGAAIEEANPWVSPRAGGYICWDKADLFPDRFQTRFEVLRNITALLGRESAPSNLRFCEETLTTLFPFWRGIAESALPANAALMDRLGEGSLYE